MPNVKSLVRIRLLIIAAPTGYVRLKVPDKSTAGVNIDIVGVSR